MGGSYRLVGFDAAAGDPLGGFRVSGPMFGWMTRVLGSMVGEGRLCLALEGGYNLRAIADASLHCLGALLHRVRGVPRVPRGMLSLREYEGGVGEPRVQRWAMFGEEMVIKSVSACK